MIMEANTDPLPATAVEQLVSSAPGVTSALAEAELDVAAAVVVVAVGSTAVAAVP